MWVSKVDMQFHSTRSEGSAKGRWDNAKVPSYVQVDPHCTEQHTVLLDRLQWSCREERVGQGQPHRISLN